MNNLKVFRIECNGVIYHVSGNNQNEAEDHLKMFQLDLNGEIDCPTEDWKSNEVTVPFEIHYDEVDEEGNPIIIMSNELIEGQTKPDVLSCSEWLYFNPST